MNLKEISWDCVQCSHLHQSRETCQAVANIVMKYYRQINDELYFIRWKLLSLKITVFHEFSRYKKRTRKLFGEELNSIRIKIDRRSETAGIMPHCSISPYIIKRKGNRVKRVHCEPCHSPRTAAARKSKSEEEMHLHLLLCIRWKSSFPFICLSPFL